MAAELTPEFLTAIRAWWLNEEAKAKSFLGWRVTFMPKPMTNKKRNERIAKQTREGETTNVRISGSRVQGHRSSSREPHNASSGESKSGRTGEGRFRR